MNNLQQRIINPIALRLLSQVENKVII